MAANPDPLLTVAESAEYLNTPIRFIRRLVAERRVTVVKVGRYVRIRRSELDRFIAEGQRSTAS